MRFLALLLVVALRRGEAAGGLEARAWNLSPVIPVESFSNLRGALQDEKEVQQPRAAFPEEALLEHLPRFGIALSGGGSRAYLSSIGYMRALHDAGALNRTRYLSSVSGGSWATAAYTYFQRDAVGMTETAWLGDIVAPERLTLDRLANELDSRSARAAPVNRDLLERVAFNLLARHVPPADVYAASVAEVFLAPAGVAADAQTAISAAHWAHAVSRNPQLAAERSVVPCGGLAPCDNKPFAILNAALLGPASAAPFSTRTDDYAPVEFTALYSGSPLPRTMRYPAPRSANLSVGGYVETFAFGGSKETKEDSSNDDEDEDASGPHGLDPYHYTAVLRDVPTPERQFSLAQQAAASSFAPGSLLSGSPLLAALNNALGMRVDYWSPLAARLRSQQVLLSDSASLENTGLLALLRRRVGSALVLLHSPVPLRSRERFDPFERVPTANDADAALLALFGVDADPRSPVENLAQDQVFPREALPQLLAEMQTAQRRGSGIVVRSALKTVRNDLWGVAAGHSVNVTWVYLGRAPTWESRLPSETRKLVQPRRHAEDASRLADRGPFKGFPHFPTEKLGYTAAQANLLANLCGWVVQQNLDLFIH